jgi:hypothetical protein
VTYTEVSENRDRHFERRLVVHVEAIAGLYAEWIQEEIRDQIALLQGIEVAVSGKLRDEVSEQLERLNDMNLRRLEDCKRRMKERVEELMEGDHRGLIEDQRYLWERLQMYESLIEELMRIRTFIIAHEASDVKEI